MSSVESTNVTQQKSLLAKGPFCCRVTSVLLSRFPTPVHPHLPHPPPFPSLPEAGLLPGPPCRWGLRGSGNVRAQYASGNPEQREFRVLGPQLPPAVPTGPAFLGSWSCGGASAATPSVPGAVPSSCQIKPLWMVMASHCRHFLGVVVPRWSLALLATLGRCPFLELPSAKPLAALGSRQHSD